MGVTCSLFWRLEIRCLNYQTIGMGVVVTPSAEMQPIPLIDRLTPLSRARFSNGIMKVSAMKRTSLILAAACVFGAVPLGRVAAQEDVVEEFDCETYLATAPVKNNLDFEWQGYEYEEDYEAYLTLDTNEVKTWNLGTSMTAGFSFSKPLASRLFRPFRILKWSRYVSSSNQRANILGACSQHEETTLLVLCFRLRHSPPAIFL